MKLPPDMGLWNWVARTVAPLGKRATSPRVEFIQVTSLFSPTLDLHGMTVQDAYQNTLAHLRAAKAAKVKKCLIITGKSGQIRQEFPFWLENHPFVTQVSEQNGGGAFKVSLS